MNGIESIAVERQRQIDVEGWTPEHDDSHEHGEMAMAGICYALQNLIHGDLLEHRAAPTWWLQSDDDKARIARLWPWQRSWWKPKSARSNLVRAGALIAAEIDRLDRMNKTPK